MIKYIILAAAWIVFLVSIFIPYPSGWGGNMSVTTLSLSALYLVLEIFDNRHKIFNRSRYED